MGMMGVFLWTIGSVHTGNERNVSKMPDRKKASLGIKEMLMRDTWRDIDADRPRYQRVLNDALALLKEQEVKPVRSVRAGRWYECPRCEHTLNRMHDKNFCGFCGQAVKWE